MSLSKMRVIISGGGTGGHVFPAIAIADALKALVPEIDILFVGAIGRMEMEKVPAAGYPIKGLWISGLQRSLSIKNLMFPLKLVHSTVSALAIIKKFKPHVVVGVGGYASGPTVRAAATLGIPTVLQEQNSYPGITNKMLAGKATSICVAYSGMENYFPREKIVITGNPVRKDILNSSSLRQQALDHFQLDGSKRTILSVGGSLGALTLNKSIHSGLQDFKQSGIQLMWQTGVNYLEKAELAVNAVEYTGSYVKPFIQRMDLAYAAADLVISRAGALSISELCVTGKPSILVPSPNVAEDHQTKNAIALVSSDAAIMITDSQATEKLVSTAIELVNNKEMIAKLASNILNLAYPEAAQSIAKIIINCANRRINA